MMTIDDACLSHPRPEAGVLKSRYLLSSVSAARLIISTVLTCSLIHVAQCPPSTSRPLQRGCPFFFFLDFPMSILYKTALRQGHMLVEGGLGSGNATGGNHTPFYFLGFNAYWFIDKVRSDRSRSRSRSIYEWVYNVLCGLERSQSQTDPLAFNVAPS